MTVPTALKGILLLGLAFAAGTMSGIVYERRHQIGEHELRSHEAIAADSHALVHRLARELELDAKQQEAVNRILLRHQQDIDSTWSAMRPHVRGAMDAAMQEIVDILRPEQVAQFRKLMDTRHH